jgi:hypothetical protein
MPEILRSTGKRNPLPYGRGLYGPGEKFTASGPDAKTLVAADLATRVEDEDLFETSPPQTPEAPPVVEQAPTAAAEANPPQAQPRKRGRPRGSYKRRDLEAEKR